MLSPSLPREVLLRSVSSVSQLVDTITIVEGNTTGNTQADFQIELTGQLALNGGDILL